MTHDDPVSPRVGLRVVDAEDGVSSRSTPRLQWHLDDTADGWTESHAEVAIARGGRRRTFAISSPRPALLAWPDEPLAPRETAEVSARLTGADGRDTSWSAPVRILCGSLHDWRAHLVGSGTHDPVLLRRDLVVDEGLRRATLYTSALGAAGWSINGNRTSDRELAPGWTSYQWRTTYDVDDVTALLRPGVNAVGAELSGAWFSEQYGFRDAFARFYDGAPCAGAQLVLDYDDGRVDVVVTDAGWRWIRGGTRSAGLYQGEEYDARCEPEGWAEPGFDDSAWAAVVPDATERPPPEPRFSPAVRVTQEVAPVTCRALPDGNYLLDFGQNLVGRLRIRLRAEPGTAVVLRHAEVLQGDVLATEPLRHAASTDTFVARGAGTEEWRPHGTFHGFRYAEISGWPGRIGDGDVVAEVLGSDLRRTGGFATSHPLLQRLHDNVVWSTRGNFLSVPTDCPQRDERLGWTGDIQVFAATATFLFDADAFLTSWLTDLRLEQDAAGGVVPMVVPAVIPQVPGLFEPIAAWGDAVAVVPTALLDAYEDDEALVLAYPGIRDWLDRVTAEAGKELLWETGRQFGDWLDPDAPPDQPARGKTDPGIVATAYLARTAALAARAARHLGHAGQAEEHQALADRVRQAFAEAYVTRAGRMVSDSATAYALAIVFDLVDEPTRSMLGERLRHVVRRHAYRISTGFVGTPLICDALTATGHAEDAGRLLLTQESPSWLHPVTMGATSIWERWDALLDDGRLNPGQMTSFNHYALGAVADWMHRALGGITLLEPGYRRFRFAPVVIEGVDDVSLWHDSPFGRIEASWVREGEILSLSLRVPADTRAEVHLPDGGTQAVGSGEHAWTCTTPARRPRPGPLDLDSPATDILDHPEAYEAVREALHAWDDDRAAELWRSVLWTPGRTLREPFVNLPVPVLERIEQVLRRCSAAEPASVTS